MKKLELTELTEIAAGGFWDGLWDGFCDGLGAAAAVGTLAEGAAVLGQIVSVSGPAAGYVLLGLGAAGLACALF